MSKLSDRVQRLETTVPVPIPHSPIAQFAEYLAGYELCRLRRIVRRAVHLGGGQFVAEMDTADMSRLCTIARERQQAGWQPNDQRLWDLGKADRVKGMAIWQLIFSLRGRHPKAFFTELSNADYCNPLDLELAEIEALARVVHTATKPEDLDAHASTIGRLILADQRVTLDVFKEVVFKGVLPSMAVFASARPQ